MMWYYLEHFKHNEHALNRMLDKVASIDEDNPLGYRFASSVQCDITFEGVRRDRHQRSYAKTIVGEGLGGTPGHVAKCDPGRPARRPAGSFPGT